MDAVEFLKEKKRMCEPNDCINCPMGRVQRNDDKPCAEYIWDCPEKAVAIVERWSSEHPIITNRQKTREVFGDETNKLTAPYEWWDSEYKAPGE